MNKTKTAVVRTEEQVKAMSNDDIARLMEKNRSYCINRNPDGTIHEIVDMKGALK